MVCVCVCVFMCFLDLLYAKYQIKYFSRSLPGQRVSCDGQGEGRGLATLSMSSLRQKYKDDGDGGAMVGVWAGE